MKKVKLEAKVLGAVAMLAIVSPLAMAADPGWYTGGDIGQSRAKMDDDKITSGLLGAGFTTTSIKEDENDIAYKIFGGYQFNKNFALEGGYYDLGKFGFTATTVPAGTLSSEIKLKGLSFDILGIIPFNEKFSAFGRVGLTYVDTRDSFDGTGAVVPTDSHPDNKGANYKFGLGLQYDFTQAFGMRVEAERYRVNDAVDNKGDIDVASIGVVYRFGQTKPAAKPAPAPAPVAAAPAPAPVVVIVPVKVKNSQYCSVLDIEYEINKDTIQDEEKEKLAVLGRFMTKYPDTTAIIEGHTDDVGTAKYNMQLSLQRADSVVRYLVDKLHIDASRLSAQGFGEELPLESNDSRQGKRSNRRINAVIACATDIEGLATAYPRITVAMEMEFDPYKADIEPKYIEELGKVADFMMTHPAITATVEGHAGKFSGVGAKQVEVSPQVSMEISERRANKVVDYLASKGISRTRLHAAAFGQSRRVSYGTTLEGQQENRRVNIIFNYPENK